MDYFKLMEQFSKASNLPLSIFEKGNLIFKGHSDKQDYNIPMFLVECISRDLPNAQVSRTPENLFFGGLSINDGNQLLFLGPVSPNECSLSQCEQILKRLGRKRTEAGTFQKIINDFALCDVSNLRDYLIFLNHVLNHEEHTEIPAIEFKWRSILFPEEYPVEITQDASDDVEDSMLAFIRNGKAEELETYFNEVLYKANNSMDRGSRDVVLRRNYVIGANILISRIAIQEGVDAKMARDLAGYYFEWLMNTENLTDINRIFYKMAVEFTRKIKSANEFIPENILIKRVNSFVQAHLYEKLSTSVIAEAIHMNEAYLSEEFKKISGKTLTEFIQESKIREAKFLLEKGYCPSEISCMLEFSSPSYFGVVFKKNTGMTPAEYKKMVE